MVFSSHLFIFYFLTAVFILYYALPFRWRNLLLTVVSYIFYGWANPLFMVLMFVSTTIDYFCGLALAGQFDRAAWSRPVPTIQRLAPRSRVQRTALVISLCSNLALLGFFKYFNLAASSFDGLVSWLGLPGLRLDLAFKVTLPMGISFYTFQAMSYAIDVYRGDARAIRSYVDYACFVSMFPQLVAGPIIRFQDVADQMQTRTHTAEKFARGVAFFALGLAKKILIANPCGKVADTVFNAASVTTFDSWYGVIAYAWQIYFDFSGYSDMAIGMGLMLGFVFAKNFDSPYISESVTEFWQRWHLSLSTWLRDNLYIPLGGNRLSNRRTYFNLAVVMLLGGLWHGAAWNFVIWGGIHGGLLAFERFFGKRTLYYALPRPFRIGFTFLIVLFTWVFFRGGELSNCLRYCGTMLGLVSPEDGAMLIRGIIYKPYYLVTFFAAGAVVWLSPQTWDWTKTITWPKAILVLLALWLSIVVLTTQAYNPFIYFIF